MAVEQHDQDTALEPRAARRALEAVEQSRDALVAFLQRLLAFRTESQNPEAARACFGTPNWPDRVPTPQATIEFEVEDVEAVGTAASELRARGHRLIHDARTEPWNQTIARLISPEGLLVGVCYTPWLHNGTGAQG